MITFSFCNHVHATDLDAANCPELTAAFGPLHPPKPKRGRVPCQEPGCVAGRTQASAYCAVHHYKHYGKRRNKRGYW